VAAHHPRGTWAIKEVGRELSLDPEATLALELAAHAAGIAMPELPCHEWVDGTPLQWHAVSAAHATNIMRVESTGDLIVVDWDAAGPVVPHQEVACFALVLAERANGQAYVDSGAHAFIHGYPESVRELVLSGPADLAMLVQGQLWWTEQNVRMALGPVVSQRQDESAAILLQNLQ
jgi:hypothetical protein